MNLVDFTLVRLADSASRAGVFDQIALEQLLSAAYNAEEMGVTGPFTAVFDEFRLGIPAPELGTLDGTWHLAGGNDHTEAQFHVVGLGNGNGNSLRVDALWRGAIVARYATGGEPITSVESNWPELGGVDAAIAAANGGVLPAEPQLEQEREARVLAAVRAGLAEPNAFTDERLAAWLDELGAASVGDLLEHFHATELGTLKVTFALPAPVAAGAKPLAIAAAIIIRDAPGFSIAQLLADSKAARERLRDLGFDQPDVQALALRHPIVVCWIVPETVFDDADWPGGDANGLTPAQRRERRRIAAGEWLAEEGIGLVAVPKH